MGGAVLAQYGPSAPRIGVIYPQTELPVDPGTVRTYAEPVERLGYDHIVAYDHLIGVGPAVHQGWNAPYDVDTTFHEPLVLYGFLDASRYMARPPCGLGRP